MTIIALNRGVDDALVFSGFELATVNSQVRNGRLKTYWTELTLYRAESGGYVLAVIGRTSKADAKEFHEATAHATFQDLLEHLRRLPVKDDRRPVLGVGRLPARLLEEAAASDDELDRELSWLGWESRSD